MTVVPALISLLYKAISLAMPDIFNKPLCKLPFLLILEWPPDLCVCQYLLIMDALKLCTALSNLGPSLPVCRVQQHRYLLDRQLQFLQHQGHFPSQPHWFGSWFHLPV